MSQSDESARLCCVGTGAPVTNVSRGWVGHRLPVMGECSACGGRVEITRRWTAKYHQARAITPGPSMPGVTVVSARESGCSPYPSSFVGPTLDPTRNAQSATPPAPSTPEEG